MEYKVVFEINNVKMVARVKAFSALEAENKIKDKIFFHKVEKIKESEDFVINFFNNLTKNK